MTQHYQDNLGGWHELDDASFEYLLTERYPNKTFTAKTQAEYDAAQVPPPPDYAAEKAQALTEARDLREKILARLNGLHVDAIYANDIPPVIAAIMVAKQALKDITIYPSVVAAVGGMETRTAVLARYYEIAATLALNAPTAVTAFTGLDR